MGNGSLYEEKEHEKVNKIAALVTATAMMGMGQNAEELPRPEGHSAWAFRDQQFGGRDLHPWPKKKPKEQFSKDTHNPRKPKPSSRRKKGAKASKKGRR